MNESNVVFSLTSTDDEIHSDLQRVDAYRNQADDYAEIPEIREADLAEAVIRRPGQPDQPFLQASANPPD